MVDIKNFEEFEPGIDNDDRISLAQTSPIRYPRKRSVRSWLHGAILDRYIKSSIFSLVVPSTELVDRVDRGLGLYGGHGLGIWKAD
jgi:hypothetical protein